MIEAEFGSDSCQHFSDIILEINHYSDVVVWVSRGPF